jgi:allophanate hydrolase subunit 1
MCIKIKWSDAEIKYDSEKPLEDQISGSKEVLIKYDPQDPDMDKFLSEMERLCSSGIGVGSDIKIDVLHNNYLNGAKAMRQVKRLKKDLNLNEAIKLLTKLQSTTDKALQEISNYCHKTT